MPLRAYYHDNLPGEPHLPHDSSRPVSLEYVEKLGYPVFLLEGPDIESQAREAAKQRGCGLTEESIYVWDFIDTPQSSPYVEHNARQLVESARNEDDFKKVNTTVGYWAALITGNAYVDLHDPFDDSWIRLEAPTGTMFYNVPGGLRRAAIENTKWIMFVEGDKSKVEMLFDKEGEDHTVHHEYRKGLGL
ncbi:hypothetical protein GYMLUDRAFT_259993 [Collybiopsis luxurians FD-317 M1]|uniref:Uncharacterized protein n=1 Tax=Collybiopsis luxurians FD-317 M1 TaxID=944289 RepID=A0A0D0D0Y0_9AGAR|nr:hypothetical protein GYMLUDRAFT_259993 [Collybiopsis luxurians FD-317 M1]